MKIKVNFLTFVLAFVVSITGMYKEFLIIFSIVIFHEFGHFLMGKICGWNFIEIEIYPYGGCVKFSERLNRKIIEEILILISGPFFQILFYLFILFLYKNNLLLDRDFLMFKNYHYTLLVFNLLPIYPLDGGRIINLFLQYMFPYKVSNFITIIISFIMVLISSLFYRDMNYIFMLVMLIYEEFVYLKRQDYLLNKLMLERYLYKYKFNRRIKVDSESMFYKERYHYLKFFDTYISEDMYLYKKYGGRL